MGTLWLSCEGRGVMIRGEAFLASSDEVAEDRGEAEIEAMR